MVAEGDRVVAFITASGTHNGEWMGVAPTGRQATWQLIHRVRVRRGQILEDSVFLDRLSLLGQLGALPS